MLESSQSPAAAVAASVEPISTTMTCSNLPTNKPAMNYNAWIAHSNRASPAVKPCSQSNNYSRPHSPIDSCNSDEAAQLLRLCRVYIFLQVLQGLCELLLSTIDYCNITESSKELLGFYDAVP
ncbi:hypothetical protein ACJRO7_033113 [Eucalyptus globulus]|uniref:Uncharacterized protein n=1 Tax=Eucalyptus globulus TaxID=34317 RepID=A0ABD3JM21_EUCGL